MKFNAAKSNEKLDSNVIKEKNFFFFLLFFLNILMVYFNFLFTSFI